MIYKFFCSKCGKEHEVNYPSPKGNGFSGCWVINMKLTKYTSSGHYCEDCDGVGNH